MSGVTGVDAVPKYIYRNRDIIHTWNPNDPCFDSKGPSFEGLTFKNRGHGWALGIYTQLYAYARVVSWEVKYSHPRYVWRWLSNSQGGICDRSLEIPSSICLRISHRPETSNDFPNCQYYSTIHQLLVVPSCISWPRKLIHPKKYSKKSGFLQNSFNLNRLLNWKMLNLFIKKNICKI